MPLSNVLHVRPDRLIRAGARRNLLSTVSVATSSQAVALTFDDGPDPRLTPDVLDVLQSRAARGTFMMVGERVRLHPALARRVAAEGHEVGLHGDIHADMRGASLRRQYQALRRGRDAIQAVTGQRVSWFRPPYGKQEPETVLACRLLGMRPLMWSTSAHDWRPDELEDQLAHVADGLRAGAVVLLHDGSARIAEPPAPPPRHQPELLERMLDLMLARRLAPVTISELSAAGDPVSEQWFERWLHD